MFNVSPKIQYWTRMNTIVLTFYPLLCILIPTIPSETFRGMITFGGHVVLISWNVGWINNLIWSIGIAMVQKYIILPYFSIICRKPPCRVINFVIVNSNKTISTKIFSAKMDVFILTIITIFLTITNLIPCNAFWFTRTCPWFCACSLIYSNTATTT